MGFGSYGRLALGSTGAYGSNPYLDNLYQEMAKLPTLSSDAQKAAAAGPQYAPPTTKKGAGAALDYLKGMAGGGQDGAGAEGGAGAGSDGSAASGTSPVPFIVGGILVVGLGYLAYKKWA